MKTKYKFRMIFFIMLILFVSLGSFAQTPQYYNYNIPGIGNSLPFSNTAGYKCQWLIAAGEINQPQPVPPGRMITKIYIFMSTTAGPITFSHLTIKLGQANITSLPVGVPYTGQLDTFFYKASHQLTSSSAAWMSITLDKPFNYNPASGLIIDLSHCGASGTGISIYQQQGTTGIFRRNPIPGNSSCVFTYSGQDTRILEVGIDVVAAAASKNFALKLPGVNTNYVGIPHQASMVGFPNITIEGWVKPLSTTSANTVLNKGGSSFDYQLGINAGGTPFFRAVGTIATGTGIIITPGIWTHLAATYNGSNVKFYKDGALVITVPFTTAMGSSTNEMRIGRGGNDAGTGNIEELRLWTTARTQGQIDSNKCRKYPTSFTNATGLKALWHFDSTYVDSVSGYNGTPTSGTVGFDTTIFPALGMNCNLVSVNPISNLIPSDYKLTQNYPNPFNPATMIEFSLPKGEFVEIILYDILGKEILTLVQEPFEAGTYQVSFNGSELASGIYIYKITAGKFTDTKKMMLIK